MPVREYEIQTQITNRGLPHPAVNSYRPSLGVTDRLRSHSVSGYSPSEILKVMTWRYRPGAVIIGHSSFYHQHLMHFRMAYQLHAKSAIDDDVYGSVEYLHILFLANPGAKIWWEMVGVSLVESELRGLVNRKLNERGVRNRLRRRFGSSLTQKIGSKKGQLI